MVQRSTPLEAFISLSLGHKLFGKKGAESVDHGEKQETSLLGSHCWIEVHVCICVMHCHRMVDSIVANL